MDAGALVRVLVLLVAVTASLAQQQVSSQDAVAIACSKATNCIQCMEAHPQCNWCIAKPTKNSQGWSQSDVRCNTRENLMSKGCPADSIKTVLTQVIEDKATPTRDASNDGSQVAVQVSPQKLTINLRPNEKKIVPLTFRLASDYPVDLYYLMDLSQSMSDDKAKVANLGMSLATVMRTITKDVRLGFGSFVDKVLMPYVNTLEERLITPCDGCESPYSFKHRLSLTEDTTEFGRKVEATSTSGNLDEPEGGFDALMQAIVCGHEIGWRENSRKMLIFSTDASFHSAGDGKLGGVLEPNDGLCHMKNGQYTYAERQDYPSISQLASKVADNRINVIFAVTASQTQRYSNLSQIIPGSVTGELESDSSNIVQLVKANYEKISSTVTMTLRSQSERSEHLNVRIRSLCNRGEFSDQASCEGLSLRDKVQFEVEVQSKCAGRTGSYTDTFEVYPLGLSESLTITTNIDCACECDDTEANSTFCSGSGTYECGICACDSAHYGATCQCDVSNVGTDTEDFYAPCTPPSNSSLVKLPCTGRGECLCGKCEACECLPGQSGPDCRRFSGKYCQCNPYNCPRNANGVCSGQGSCECDEDTAVHYCLCDAGYTGNECQCPDSNNACFDEDNVECSNKGRCECGACVCDQTEDERYFGQYCEECLSCKVSKCSEFRQCVECKAYQELGWESSSYSQDRCDAICHGNTTAISSISIVDSVLQGKGVKPCSYLTTEDCQASFTYYHVPREGYRVLLKREQDCPVKPNYIAIIAGVVAAIVFIGLVALIIWKIFTTVHDRREFAKFEKDRKDAQWHQTENPIYVQAKSTFKNPMYRGSVKADS